MNKFLSCHWVNYFLLVAFIFISATALRFTVLPIGVSESVFVGLFVYFQIKKRPLFDSNFLRELFPNLLTLLWFLLFLVFCFGFFINLTKLHDLNSMVSHNFLAYLFISIILYVISHPKIQLNTCIKYGALWIPLLALPLLLTSNLGWYQSRRFEALSVNPNQFALMLLLLPFWQIYFFASFERVGRCLCFLSMIVVFTLGILTATHALWLAWLLSITLGLFWYLGQIIRVRSRLGYRCFWLSIFCFVLLVSLLFFHFNLFIQQFIQTHLNTGEIGLRWRLWGDGLRLWTQSPLLGFGPGAFLNADVPGGIGAYEAHNVFIDVLLQGGIVGLLVYLLILAVILKAVWGNPLFMMMFFSLIIFSCFHFILRHPIVWIGLYWLFGVHSDIKAGLV